MAQVSQTPRDTSFYVLLLGFEPLWSRSTVQYLNQYGRHTQCVKYNMHRGRSLASMALSMRWKLRRVFGDYIRGVHPRRRNLHNSHFSGGVSILGVQRHFCRIYITVKIGEVTHLQVND